MSKIETLADRLAEQLDARGLSARAAAQRVGVHPTMMARWVAGDRAPDVAGLEALMRLGISANWLLTGEGSPAADAAETAQYRAGRRDGLAEARGAIQRLEERHGATQDATRASEVAETGARAAREIAAAEKSGRSAGRAARRKDG